MHIVDTMQTETTVKAAVERSVSHTETVRLEVENLMPALVELVQYGYENYTSTNVDDVYDVWGTTEGGDEWRLQLVVV